MTVYRNESQVLSRAFDGTNNAIKVENSDGSAIGGGGGGADTQYTDAASTAAHPVGTMPVYDNAGAISKVGTSNGLPVQPVKSSVNVGQTTTDGTAVRLNGGTSIVATNDVVVQALAANVGKVYIGGSGVLSTTGMELQPGQSAVFACSNVNALYVIGTNGDKVCWNVV